MKNMINQLWASQDKCAKSFLSSDGVPFGWKAIRDMWAREKERRDNDLIRIVPGLLQSFIERDAWTKLNVKPAKIMQVSYLFLCIHVFYTYTVEHVWSDCS